MRSLLLAAALGLLFAEVCAAQAGLPVREVVLFTSGVGYFEHAGSVSGNATVELRFRTGQINDVLKSLLVQDLGGGRVGAVVYPSQDPLGRTLRSFAVDLTGTPSLGELLNQLRGAAVRVHTGGLAITGTIVGVERRSVAAGGATSEEWVMTLLSGGGLRAVRLDAAERIELLDPALRAELDKALEALAGARDADRKPVEIRFNGAGSRGVRVGYVVETPVWKTSYRLVLPGPGERQAYLQGWAIVENQTEADWEDVSLSLVSGRPVSFIQNLYQPLYADRPVVPPDVPPSVRPRVYEGGVELPAAADGRGGASGLSGRVLDADSGEPLPGATVVVEGTGQGTATDARGSFRIPNVPPGLHAVRASFVGYADGVQTVEVGRGPVTLNFALRSRVELEEVVVSARDADFAVEQAGAPPAPPPLDPSASVAAQGVAEAVGELFQYTVTGVSLPRQRSAMIPIVTQRVEAERVSIFNPAVHATRPMRGARLVNATGLHLAPGPVTVLDEGRYAGDARLPELPPGQERLLSFAMDLDLEVDVAGDQETQQIRQARITNGVLVLSRRLARRVVYTIENEGERDRMVVVEHARHEEAELVDTPAPISSTPEVHRFRVPVGAGETVPFTVREETALDEQIVLAGATTDQLYYYAQSGGLPAEVRRALERAVELQGEVARVEEQMRRLEQERAEITAEQGRIRENMRTVQPATDYYRRLLARLEEQENRLEAIQRELAALRTEHRSRHEALVRYLEGLEVG